MARGRPKGSKNKVKTNRQDERAVPLDVREVKRTLRMLRKIKKDTRKGSEERHDLCRKIRELRKQLKPLYIEITPEKSEIIKKILERRPEYTILKIDLGKYTLEQLEKHYGLILHKERLF